METMNQNGVALVIKDKINKPIADINIPAEAKNLGCIESESLPATGDNKAINTGEVISIIPALCAVNSLIYCRYKLSINVIAKVAL